MSTMHYSLGLGSRPAPSSRGLSWSERWEGAPCTQTDPELWYAESDVDRRKAIELCRECPLKTMCADAGAGERYGVWGGVDHFADEREKRRDYAEHKRARDAESSS